MTGGGLAGWTQLLEKGVGPQSPIGPEAGLAVVVGITLLSVAPAVLISLTSFTRITIVLTFLRQGIGLPGVPPNQVMAALALFLTLFSMQPTLDEIWKNAAQPCLAGKLKPLEAAEKAAMPVREFMLRQTRPHDLLLMTKISGCERPRSPGEISLVTLSASFLLSELKTAFQIGLVILLPFVLVDLAVSLAISVLGLSGLSTTAVAVPIKLALFVSIDGWNLVVGSLLRSIH
jgi:flagellar biosynthesis protein FliP